MVADRLVSSRNVAMAPGETIAAIARSRLEALHNLGWGAMDAFASPRLRLEHNPSGEL